MRQQLEMFINDPSKIEKPTKYMDVIFWKDRGYQRAPHPEARYAEVFFDSTMPSRKAVDLIMGAFGMKTTGPRVDKYWPIAPIN